MCITEYILYIYAYPYYSKLIHRTIRVCIYIYYIERYNMPYKQRYRDVEENIGEDDNDYYSDGEEEFDHFSGGYLAEPGSSLNTGKQAFFYNDMNPHHTRGVFIILGLAFCFLMFLVFSIVNDFDAIVRFMKVHHLVPPKHHRNIFHQKHHPFVPRRPPM